MEIARRDDPLDRRLALERAAALVDVRLELRAPVLEIALHRIHGEVAERAQGLAQDAPADGVEQVELGELGIAGLDALEELHHPARPFAARRAFAARLV